LATEVVGVRAEADAGIATAIASTSAQRIR
jgi:hypothetical protein